jgi:multiple sugar transport system substrate-binding protein
MSFFHISRRTLLKNSALGFGALAAPALLKGFSKASAQTFDGSDLADLEGVEINLLVNSAHGKSWDFLSERFKKDTGGIAKATAVPYTQLAQKQLLDIQSGSDQFDLFNYQTQLTGTLVEAGGLLDITQWVEANRADLNIDDLSQSAFSQGFVDGRLYGITNVAVPDLVYYNKEIFDRLGLTPPKTWEEFTAVSAEITAKGEGRIFGSALQLQKDATTLLMTYGNRLSGYGGRYLDENGAPVVNSDAAVAALEELAKQLKSALPDPLQTAWQQATSAFLEGRIALLDSWGDISYLGNDPTQSQVVGKFGTLPLLRGASFDGTVRPVYVNAEALGITASSKNPTAGAAWLKWVSRRDVSIDIATRKEGNWPLVYKEVLKSPEYRAYNTFADITIAQVDGDSLFWPNVAGSVQAAQALSDQIANSLAGQIEPRAALDIAQSVWEEVHS